MQSKIKRIYPVSVFVMPNLSACLDRFRHLLKIQIHIFFICTFFISCHKKNKEVVKSDVIQSTSVTQYFPACPDFPTWYSAQYNVTYNDGKITQDVQAHVRMKKDSITWISLTGFFGIEGARVLVNKDSVFLMNKLNKTYSVETTESLAALLPIATSQETIQRILIGNVQFEKNNSFTEKKENNQTTYHSISDSLNIVIHTNNTSCVEAFSIDFPKKNIRVLAAFSEFQKTAIGYVPNYRKYKVEQGNQIIEIGFQLVKFDAQPIADFPFSISEKYQRVPLFR